MPDVKIRALDELDTGERTKDWSEVTGCPINSTSDGVTTKRALDVAVNLEARLVHAIHEIKATYDDDVIIKPKSLLKFGRSNQVSNTTRTTLMNLPTGTFSETYVTDNLITTASSSSTSDSEICILDGHTIDGSGNLTFVTQAVDLDGRNQVTLTTPLARATRLYNNDSTALAGSVYIYEDDTDTDGTPDTDAGVHLIIPAGKQQSFKASTSVSQSDYWIITEVGGGVEKKASAFADIELEIRLQGKVFRERFNFDVSSPGGTVWIPLDPCLIVPKNADVRLTALADTANTSVTGFMDGYLALIQS